MLNYADADKVSEDFLFVTRHRGDLEEVKDVIQRFCSQIQIERKTNLNIKTQQVLLSLSLNDVRIFLRDGPFQSDRGIVNFYPSEGTRWVCYTNNNYADSYGCPPPKNYIILI